MSTGADATARSATSALRAVLRPDVATALTGVVCTAVAFGVAGGRAAGGAGIGAAVVVLFLASSSIPIRVATGLGIRAGLGLALLLLTYTLRLMLAFVVIRIGLKADAVDARAFGLTVIACGLTWTFAALVPVLSERRALVGSDAA
ncbi:MAG: hypothetical protein ACTHQ3_17815 [Motilibacteraceae bacterium]